MCAGLRELEQLMNQIKMSILLSQKAVKEAEDRKNELVLEFSHEDIAPDEVEQYLSIPANGAVRWPAAKWIPVLVRKNALPLLTAAVFTQNRTGTSVSIPLSHGERRNIRKSTITGLPARV